MSDGLPEAVVRVKRPGLGEDLSESRALLKLHRFYQQTGEALRNWVDLMCRTTASLYKAKRERESACDSAVC